MNTSSSLADCAAPAGCRVVELRQYTLHPGRREELITLFEREFIHTQQALGLHVLGIFRDADDADRFVWLRGFANMAARRAALEAFYGGPVWRRHRNAANATMIDSDDVLLLRPQAGALVDAGSGNWHALICPLAAPLDEAQRAALQGQPAAWFDSEPTPNDFPRLPVRPGCWLLALSPQAPTLPGALQPALSAAPRRLRLQATEQSPLR